MNQKTWPKTNADVCIRCANCMAVCPVSRVTPLFPGPKHAGPGAERFRKPGDPSVDKWIDLCIGCHLCDLACSSGVPISELNLMAKAKYLDEKGRPLRDWLLTHTYLFSRMASFLSIITNFLLMNRMVKWLADHLLDIDKRRELPAYQSPTFRQWFREHPPKGERKVAYFYGCYINTNEVEVGKAMVQVLEANGFEVFLPPQECCGLPMLGNGDFKGAREMGLKNVPSLLETIRSGTEMIYSSTSCGHMIRHEYNRLLNIPGSEEVAEHLFDLFEFLKNLNEKGDLKVQFIELPIKVAYFAPCHLRSLGIGLPALEILRLIPRLEIENIEADCCGLGGTFGFKREKYEISQEIGKDLKEAIDKLKPDVVLTDCEGCRMQIRHLTGLKVLHPIQILREALTEPVE
ncbi:MAG: anaerobic glycerol-3-phosphate dehydrogenase subunit C [Deltaproteobacteria bacterium]|nr:anaerobic glycerol-3-phosphate dehydrogenase subunit C [Deltaproteobacteria bacterium]